MAQEIDVQRFDMAKMCQRVQGKNPTLAFFGSRGSGKSVMMREVLYHYHLSGVPRVVVFSGTEGQNSYFESFIPGCLIHSPVSVGAIENVYEAQKELKMKQQIGLIPADQDLRLVMVLDDVAFDKKVLNSKVISELALNGRHSDIILMISIQYLMTISVSTRSNIDYAFLMSDFNMKNRERIKEQFGAVFNDARLFNAVFTACTQDYECFILPGKSNKSPRPEDNCFYYRADINLKFRFGPPEVWRFNERRYLSPSQKYVQQLKEAEEREEKLKAEMLQRTGGADDAAGGPVGGGKKRNVVPGKGKDRAIIVTRR